MILFASFILLCGLTHLLSIKTLWLSIYPYVGLVKLATGVVSAITAIVLFRLIPTLVSFPSPAKLRETNKKLREEIAAHEKTLAMLDAPVANRTAELSEASAKLSVQAREAVHRSANLLSVASSLTKQTARGHTQTDEFIDTLMGRIRSLALATSTEMRVSEDYPAILPRSYANNSNHCCWCNPTASGSPHPHSRLRPRRHSRSASQCMNSPPMRRNRELANRRMG